MSLSRGGFSLALELYSDCGFLGFVGRSDLGVLGFSGGERCSLAVVRWRLSFVRVW